MHAKPENWDPIDPDSYVPMEPFGYNLDGKKLGFLNECIYGCNLLAEAALMQFHPLDERTLLYTAGPVGLVKRGARAWSLRSLGAASSLKAAVQATASSGWRITTPEGRRLPLTPAADGWQAFELPPASRCLIEPVPQEPPGENQP